MTMTLIQRYDVTAATEASITFSNIPQNYDDLYLLLSIRTTRTTSDGLDPVRFNVNGSLGSMVFFGRFTSPFSGTDPYLGLHFNNNSTTSNSYGIGEVLFSDYTVAKAHYVNGYGNVASNSGTQYGFQKIHGYTTSTAAITTIQIVSGTGNSIVQHSSASLYGITKGSDGSTTVS